MSFLKQQLKTAKEALQSKNYEYCQSLCESILEQDPQNYNALVFLGLSELNLDHIENAQQAYERAIQVQPKQLLAYQGLEKLFEQQQNDQELLKVLSRLQDLYLEQKDRQKTTIVYEKQLQICQKLNDINGQCHLLTKQLPQSPLHGMLDNPLDPLLVWKQIAQIQKQDYDQKLKKLVDEQRKRLSADPFPVLFDRIEKELLFKYNLHPIFQNILELEQDEQEFTKYQLVFLHLMDRMLYHSEDKQEFKTLWMEMALDLKQKHVDDPNLHRILLDMHDGGLLERDPELIQQLKGDLAPLGKCFMEYTTLKNAKELVDQVQKLTEKSETHFAMQLLMYIYRDLRQYENCILQGERLLRVLEEYEQRYAHVLDGLRLDTLLISVECHLQLKSIVPGLQQVNHILAQHPENVQALLFRGQFYLELGNHKEAMECVNQVSKSDPTRQDVQLLKADTLHLMGNNHEALEILKSLKSNYRVKYSICKVYWALGGIYRTDKQYLHGTLVLAVKENPEFSPSFTLLGNYYMQENDLNRAGKCYLKAIEISNDQDAVKELVNIYIAKKNVSDAIILVQQFCQSNPRSFWGWNQLGIFKLHAEKPSEAITHFQNALRIDVKHANCWSCLGEAYLMEGKLQASLKALKRAIDLEPDLYIAVHTRAVAFYRLSQFEESLEAFKTALSLNPQMPTHKYLIECLLEYCKHLYENGQYGRLYDHLCQGIQHCLSVLKNEYHDVILKQLGDLLVTGHRLIPHLLTHDLHPVFLEARQYLGSESTSTEPLVVCLEAAALCFSKLIETTKSGHLLSRYYHDCGTTYYHIYRINQQYLQESIDCLKKAIGYNQSEPDAWNSLGLVMIKEDPPLAQHCFIQSLELDNAQPMIWSNLGFFYMLHQDMELAQQAFKKAQFYDPEYVYSWLGQYFVLESLGTPEPEFLEHAYNLGKSAQFELLFAFAQSRFDTKDLSDASFALLKCVEAMHPSASMHNLYGLILEKQGQFEQALVQFDKALLLEPSKKVVENKARIFGRLKRYQESIDCYLDALKDGEDPITRLSLGIVYFFVQEYENSLHCFEQAIEHASGSTSQQVSLYLSQVLFAFGTEQHLSLAKDQLLGCFKRDPQFVQAIIHLFAMGIQQGDWELAHTSALELIKLEPHALGQFDTDLDQLLAYLYQLQQENVLAKRQLSKMVHRAPSDGKRWNIFSKLISNDPGLKEQALASAQASLSLESSNQAKFYADTGLSLLGTKESKSMLLKAVRMNPSSPESWIALGVYCSKYEVEHLEHIAQSIENVAERDVEHYWARAYRLQSMIINNEAKEEAVQLADDMASNAPTEFLQRMGYTFLGQLLQQDDPESALLAFEKASADGWPPALREYGLLCAQLGQFEKADELLKQVAQQPNPLKTDALLQRALLYMNQDKIQDGLDCVNQVLQNNPTHQTARFLQTWALIKNGGSQSKIQKLMSGLAPELVTRLSTLTNASY